MDSVVKESKAVLAKLKDVVLTPVKRVLGTATDDRVVTLAKGKDFASQVKKEDTWYIVKYDFDLGGVNVYLPKGCTLEFKGGTLHDGTLVGSDSTIHGDRKVFFDVELGGTWNCVGDVRWFADCTSIVNDQWGCRIPELVDRSKDIQAALDSPFRELHFPPSAYYITNTLVLRKEKSLILHGSPMKLSLEQAGMAKMNTCIIFSDKDVTLLQIAVSESQQNAVSVEGGNFDVSKCPNYTHNCIEVMASEVGQRLWGVVINTNVKGKYNITTGVGINVNPVECPGLKNDMAYITQVRINSNVSNFGTGVKAMNYMDASTGLYYNWCTDLVVDGSIQNCPTAVDTNVEDTDIRATIQAGYYFDKKDNGQPLVAYSGVRGAMNGAVYDIQLCAGGKYANQYALEISTPNACVDSYGRFEAFRRLSEKLGKTCVKL